MPVGRDVGALQLAEHGDGVHGESDTLRGIADLAAQSRALRSRDLADVLRAFDQQDVGPARPGERVSAAKADGAAANDDEFGAGEIVHAGGDAWCVVPEAWCVVRGAWCVVRGAWEASSVFAMGGWSSRCACARLSYISRSPGSATRQGVVDRDRLARR